LAKKARQFFCRAFLLVSPLALCAMLLPLYLPSTSDYGFKVTFGNPHNTEFLRRALQALIRSEVPYSGGNAGANCF
jgi:hypothetical protein